MSTVHSSCELQQSIIIKICLLTSKNHVLYYKCNKEKESPEFPGDRKMQGFNSEGNGAYYIQ